VCSSDLAGSWVASNHIEFTGLGAPLRLTTDLSLTHVQEGRPFSLVKKQHLALTWGEPLESPLEATLDRFLGETVRYWRRWVKRTRVPRDYQEAVIRSALTLKLHQFEDTGAFLAATTTSLPEHPGSGRNWDYRFCWLRDTYFTLNALERLGHLQEMERFLNFLRDLCALRKDALQPLYGINGEADLEERILDHLDGYRGEKPVRIGNQAIEHVQNDVYGEMILAVKRFLVDKRFVGTEGVEGARELIDHLLRQIEARLEQPDAGLWELRSEQKLHAFTVLMHWAGGRSVVTVAEELGDPDLTARGAQVRDRAREILLDRCWDSERGVLTQAAGVRNLDASMLLALQLGFFDGDDPRARSHVETIRAQLSIDGGLLRRYDVEDDFGIPKAAFTVCSFWLAEALGMVGRVDEGRELLDRLLSLDNGLGLFSEDILPEDGSQSGNFPQTYSHVGLIHAAFRLSRPWD
ncbi:MAG: glycoside hydrolase family 15 protein, partial [Planctomycetota bacterium JB042]